MSTRMTEQLQLGKLKYSRGQYKQAFRDLLPVAVYGQPQAEYAVGYMYYYGYGVTRDTESGLFWMQKAADCGFLPAIKALELIRKGPAPCLTTDVSEEVDDETASQSRSRLIGPRFNRPQFNQPLINQPLKNELSIKSQDEVLKSLVENEVKLADSATGEKQIESTPPLLISENQSKEAFPFSENQSNQNLEKQAEQTVEKPSVPLVDSFVENKKALPTPASPESQAKLDSLFAEKRAVSRPQSRSAEINEKQFPGSMSSASPDISSLQNKNRIVAENSEPRIIEREVAKDIPVLPKLKKEMHTAFKVMSSSAKTEEQPSKVTPSSIATADQASFMYALQVFGAYKLENVKNLQQDLQLENSTQIWHTQNQGKDWYVLTHGNFASTEEARRARDKLSTDVKELDPWVRKIHGLELIG